MPNMGVYTFLLLLISLNTGREKGLWAIRAKIGPTSDVDKFSPKCIHNMCFSEINTVS